MQNSIQKFRQSSIVFEKPGIVSENLETLTSSNHPTVQYFFAETLHAFCTYQCLQKGVWDLFIMFRSWVICQNSRDLVSTHSCFTFLLMRLMYGILHYLISTNKL